MKKAFYLFFLLFGLSVCVLAQNNTPRDIPKDIPKRLYYMQITKFPNGTDLAWKVLPDGTFSVTFRLNGKSGFAHYDKNFADMETHSETDSASLPRPVVQTIDSLYGGYHYQNVTHFTTSTPAQNDEVFLKYTYDYYQILLTKEKNSLKLYFSPDGKLLNRIERKIGK
jgi:hypothetical protein